jgi:hypothetical protein
VCFTHHTRHCHTAAVIPCQLDLDIGPTLSFRYHPAPALAAAAAATDIGHSSDTRPVAVAATGGWGRYPTAAAIAADVAADVAAALAGCDEGWWVMPPEGCENVRLPKQQEEVSIIVPTWW